ncbi:MAG: molybdopterin-dependent oxidoreductase [Gammaproteobacteria bacterium]|nr:molybdopterin-dependent oxidoreductase [Gammaproteobacteria bacterium]
MSVVGKSVPRPDALDKVTGGKAFPVNFTMPGMLHGKILRSPYPHARIRSIDTRAALAVPGVKAILTHQDVPQRKYTTVYFVPTDTKSMPQDMLILSDTVRYAGQPVAAVAATSADIAEQALALIEIDYEELPAVFDPEEAMQDGAPQLHEGAKNNIAVAPRLGAGDIDAGFAQADHIFEGVYSTQRVHTCYLEPRVCVAEWDAQGDITINSSMQHLFGLREKLSFALEIPPSRIRVIKPPYIGGGFGGKLDIGYIEPIAVLLSRQSGRPVRIEQTRYEDFITTTRNPIKVYLKTGVTNDGRVVARHTKSILDAGAHATHGAEVINVHGFFLTSGYRVPNFVWEGYSVYTNNMVGGGYRGYGGPQAYFAIESQHDEVCEALGFDPIEFRKQNTSRKGDPHPMLPGVTLDSYELEAVLDRGVEAFGWAERQPANSGAGTKKRGLGIAMAPLWVSGCVGFPDIYEHSGAIIKLNPDGTADLSTAAMDIGSGQITILLQIAAEELGLSMDQIRMTTAVDTTNVPFDAPTHASRVTYSAGNAVKAAASAARERVLEVAGIMLEASTEDLELADGRVSVAGAPDRSLSIAEVAARADSPFVQFTADGPAPTTLEEKGTIIGLSSMAPPGNPSPVAAGFVEVEVDTDTGEVEVTRVVYTHDIGRVINPNAAEGQVEGGFQQGIGYALMEEIQFDADSGSCLTGDFLDYKIPTAVEMPPAIESIFIESMDPTGPFGAKSLSETCIVVPAPAIANAIYNACGARVRELPITPEKVLQALGKL